MNSIDISGRVRENIDDLFRYLEYELPYMEESSFGPAKIVMKYWSNMPNARLITLKEGTRVLIHGHLDAHEKFGTILIVEQLESLH